MTNPKLEYKERDPLTMNEIDSMLQKASQLSTPYFRLRAKCLISLLEKWGRRRVEIARIKFEDIEIKEGCLFIDFYLAKKCKRGFHQFMQYTEKHNPELLDKSYNELQPLWRSWQNTPEGRRIKPTKRTRKVELRDRFCMMILEYIAYMHDNEPKAVYLFPSGRSYFGEHYIMDYEKPLSGSQLLRIIKPLNPQAWLHLFRNYVASVIVAEDSSIIGAQRVQKELNLERLSTAWAYIEKYAIPRARTEL